MKAELLVDVDGLRLRRLPAPPLRLDAIGEREIAPFDLYARKDHDFRALPRCAPRRTAASARKFKNDTHRPFTPWARKTRQPLVSN